MPGYRKRINRTEAAERRLMITKDAWRRFPAPGEAVHIRHAGVELRGRVEGERCSGVPPVHEHRYLKIPGLFGSNESETGDTVHLEVL